jgi:hypothetical protein
MLNTYPSWREATQRYFVRRAAHDLVGVGAAANRWDCHRWALNWENAVLILPRMVHHGRQCANHLVCVTFGLETSDNHRRTARPRLLAALALTPVPRRAIAVHSVPDDQPWRSTCACGRPLWASAARPTGRCTGCGQRVGAPPYAVEAAAGIAAIAPGSRSTRRRTRSWPRVSPVNGRITCQTSDGTCGETVTDEVGCFVLDRPPAGPVRLQLSHGDHTVVTSWIRLP